MPVSVFLPAGDQCSSGRNLIQKPLCRSPAASVMRHFQNIDRHFFIAEKPEHIGLALSLHGPGQAGVETPLPAKQY